MPHLEPSACVPQYRGDRKLSVLTGAGLDNLEASPPSSELSEGPRSPETREHEVTDSPYKASGSKLSG